MCFGFLSILIKPLGKHCNKEQTKFGAALITVDSSRLSEVIIPA